MKVLMIVPYRFIPPIYGGQKVAFNTCVALSQYVSFACLTTRDNGGDSTPFRTFKLISSKVHKYLNPLVMWRSGWLMKKMGVRSCLFFQPFMVPLLSLPMWLLGTRTQIYVQNIEFQRFRSIKKPFWPILFILEWIVYRRSEVLYFISEEDMHTAIRLFSVDASKCVLLPYCTELDSPPMLNEIQRQMVRERHGFASDDFLILFYGSLDYKPNVDAIEHIVNDIYPLLKASDLDKFQFVICGKGLREKYQIKFQGKPIVYLGEVQEINSYLRAMDVVINPVNLGGGVKIKVLEALANDLDVVSTRSGAKGIEERVCGNKLKIAVDSDWEDFCRKILEVRSLKNKLSTPPSFYEYYHREKWLNSVIEALLPRGISGDRKI